MVKKVYFCNRNHTLLISNTQITRLNYQKCSLGTWKIILITQHQSW